MNTFQKYLRVLTFIMSTCLIKNLIVNEGEVQQQWEGRLVFRVWAFFILLMGQMQHL